MLTSRSRLTGWVTFIKAAAKMLVLARLLQGREAIIAAARLARSACQGGTHGMACQVPGTPDASPPSTGPAGQWRSLGAWICRTTHNTHNAPNESGSSQLFPCPLSVHSVCRARPFFSFFLFFHFFKFCPFNFPGGPSSEPWWRRPGLGRSAAWWPETWPWASALKVQSYVHRALARTKH
jgi:hypothetical protein